MNAAVVDRIPVIVVPARPVGECGPAATMTATLRWRSERPHEVTMRIDGVVWTIGWDLLRDGLHRPVGGWDVMVTPHPNEGGHEIVLSSPYGCAAVQLLTASLADFVRDVAAVWTDRAATDDDLAALLDGAS